MDNQHKFDEKGSIYSKYRPTYPPECIDYIIGKSEICLTSSIADIGAGTGIFSKLFLERGYAVTAVEPNDDMRAIAISTLKGYPNFTPIKATAERTTLLPNSTDLVTVAQAFHWFDADSFRDECKRILKPNGRVALVWNSRDAAAEIVRENAEICLQCCPSFQGFSQGSDTSPDSLQQFYRNNSLDITTFPFNLEYSLEQFTGRNLSSSYAPKPNEKHYQEFVDKLTKLFHKHEGNGYVVVPNYTKCYIGTL